MPASPHFALVMVLAGAACVIASLLAWWTLRGLREASAARRQSAEISAALDHERAEHARVAAEMHSTLESERELVALRSRFVSLVSHEFRTPLGIIMSAGELLKNYRERLPLEQQQDLLDDILGSTRRMASLMEQVLLLGRVDAGKIAARVVPIDLAALLHRLVDEQRSASDARCPIDCGLSGDLAGARADEGLLRHILSNLLSNGVKYSASGSLVRCLVRREANDAVFEVIDAGIGIPDADVARVFEAFSRASNVGEIPGSGLGLLIVKRCVDLHGGRISVRSRVGEGTTFEVRLPLFVAPQLADAGGHPADAAPRSMASRMVS